MASKRDTRPTRALWTPRAQGRYTSLLQWSPASHLPSSHLPGEAPTQPFYITGTWADDQGRPEGGQQEGQGPTHQQAWQIIQATELPLCPQVLWLPSQVAPLCPSPKPGTGCVPWSLIPLRQQPNPGQASSNLTEPLSFSNQTRRGPGA